MQKGFGVLVFILIIGLISSGIIGGVYFYKKSSLKPTEPKTTTATSQPSQVTPSPDETPNWKTYTNKKLKFIFNYPDNYKIESEDDEKVTFSGTFDPGHQVIPSEMTLFFKRIKNLQTLKNCEDVEPKDNVDTCIDGKVETKSFNGIQMDSYNLITGAKNTQSSSDYVIQTVNEPRIEFVHHVLGGGVPQRMDQILSTFKFLK